MQVKTDYPDMLLAKKQARELPKITASAYGPARDAAGDIQNIWILPGGGEVNDGRARLAFDRSPSMRREDDNGFLHVASSHITKATVNPYRGGEIPGWREAGLDPERIYYGLRDPEELKKSLKTWEGLPLHIEHHLDSADEPAKLTRVGAVGTGARWNGPYVDAPLTIWDGEAIDAVRDGSFRELSCAYFYTPDFTPGQYEGIPYDFVMRDIRGNHVALVEEGRAGRDVLVADAALDAMEGDGWITTKNGKRIHFRDGEIDKGNIGQREGKGSGATREVTITGDELGSWSDVKELRQKAVSYYREHFQGKPAWREDIGEIRFSRKGRNEMEAYSADPDKLLMVPALRDIIETGELGEEEKLKHPRRDGIVAFVPVTKKVKFKGEYREVEVLLGKDENGHLYYDLFLDASRQGGKKKSPAAYPEQIQGPQGTFPSVIGLEQNPGLTGDAAGNPTVEINIRMVPAMVKGVLAGDHATTHTQKPNPIKGAIMKGLKRLFRGAKDASPDIEREEVDLAQAIIDLHKLDPNTGEIVDITEDEDKAAEIRRLVGEFAGKLEPEELKKLTDALSDLAYSKATGDSDPGKPGLDDDARKAMDACGLDADDEDAQAAFAEGVKYGESLIRNPAERAKLDREHESEGMRKAMSDCGLDAENPQESHAFAEGVKYGEKLERNPDERRKLDREHEREGEEKALGRDEDKNAAISRILDEVPDLTPAQREKLASSLQDLAYAKATGDADCRAAQDAALRRRGPALDAARIRAGAVAETQPLMRRLNEASRAVRPLVGDIDPLAFDSAADIYAYALKENGVNPRDYPRQAWAGMVDVMRSGRALGSGSPRLAADSAMARTFDGPFAGLKNITVAD